MRDAKTSEAGQTFANGLLAVENLLSAACDYYEKTAPTVAEHCDELYRRIQSGSSVTLKEIITVCGLCGPDGWDQPNYAANTIYKLRHSLGMDTTGHAGF